MTPHNLVSCYQKYSMDAFVFYVITKYCIFQPEVEFAATDHAMISSSSV